MLKKLLSYIVPIRLYKSESKISKTIEITLYNGELVLDSQNTNYSYGSLQRVLRYGLKQIGFDTIKEMSHILVLGVAGGSVIKTLVNDLKYEGTIRGVEIDSSIIEIANSYFNLDKIQNFEVVIADAEQFLKQETRKYDLIIVDIFQDKEMPSFLFKEEFSQDLVSVLKNNGRILFNTMNISKEDEGRNQKYKLNYPQDKFEIFVYSGIEEYNELFIIKRKG